MLTRELDEIRRKGLYAQPSFDSMTLKRHKARLNSLSLAHANRWLNVIPSPVFNSAFTDDEFRSLLRLKLGLRVFVRDDLTCPCGKPFDPYGDHALVCQLSKQRYATHNALSNVILDSCRKAALQPRLEQSGILRDQSRPGDVYIPIWTSGRPAAIDISVTHPMCGSLVHGSSLSIGSAAGKRFEEKMTKSYDKCQERGVNFYPFVLETMGGFHESAVEVATKLARQISSRSTYTFKEELKFLLNRISVTLQREISSCMTSNQFYNKRPQFVAIPTLK